LGNGTRGRKKGTTVGRRENIRPAAGKNSGQK